MSYTQEQWIEKANKIHNNKYKYSDVIYKKSSEKVYIICDFHGKFLQAPSKHLQGIGCPKCYNEKRFKNRALTLYEFIEKAILVHGNKYDYSKVEYKNNRAKIEIICNKKNHGSFFQSPDNHINQKSGCPKCNESFGEKLIRNYLILNNIQFIQQKTFNDLKGKTNNSRYKFDFYLPDFNLCIEYDGQQHFEPSFPRNNKNLAKDNFSNIKIRDNLKTEYCNLKGIKLLRIPYWKKSNINEILNKIIGENQK